MRIEHRKNLAKSLIEIYIRDIREFHDSTTVDRYDGAVQMAKITGLISAEEKEEFDSIVDNMLYV